MAYLSGAFSARAPSAGFIRPCQPFLVVRPPAGLGWLHEVKHDGYRIVARKDGEQRQVMDPIRRGFHGPIAKGRGGGRQPAR